MYGKQESYLEWPNGAHSKISYEPGEQINATVQQVWKCILATLRVLFYAEVGYVSSTYKALKSRSIHEFRHMQTCYEYVCIIPTMESLYTAKTEVFL